MQDVEQKRLDERRERTHLLEVEHLKSFEGERVFDVVEQVSVSAAIDPLLEPGHQSPRQEIGQSKEPALTALQNVEVLDSVVHFTILKIAQAISVLAFEQQTHE